MNSTLKSVLIVSAILCVLYFLLMAPARQGFGYAGYQGYYGGPSFFFWNSGGDNRRYYNRNVRSGSVGSSSFMGGGPRSGK